MAKNNNILLTLLFIHQHTIMFKLRAEYLEYCQDCEADNEKPWSFRNWFETVYHYDMADELPTGEQWDGTFAHYSAICLN